MTNPKIEIEKYAPCDDALEYRKQYETFEQAWNECVRGDWMLWIAKRVGVDLKILTLAKGHCANTVRHLMNDGRSLAGVDAAIAFGEGKITRDDVDRAADAADAAADAADAAAAYAYAADACDADAAAADAKKENQKKTADICRQYLTNDVLKLIQSC